VRRLRSRAIRSVGEAERRLEAAGETRAHEWAFALREVLLDYRHLDEALASMDDPGR
jgi:hypothetical protein